MLSFVSNDPAENTDYSLNFLRSWRSFLIVLADVKVGIFYVSLQDDEVNMTMLENTVRTIKDQVCSLETLPSNVTYNLIVVLILRVVLTSVFFQFVLV